MNKLVSFAFVAVIASVGIFVSTSSNRQTWAAEEAEADFGSMIGAMVALTPAPGEEEMVEAQMKWFASECIAKEPGTLMYTITKDENGVIGTMEVYKDAAAFKFHGDSAHHAVNVEKLGGGKIADFKFTQFTIVNHPTR